MTFDSFDEYQLRTGDTDFIKPECRLAYYPLGLSGEVGEVIEKMSVTYQHPAPPEHCHLVALELGDVMWFVARMAAMLDIKMSSLADDFSVQGFQMDTDENEACVYPDRILGAMHRMSVAAGKVADCVKKAIRDNNNTITKDKRIDIILSLITIMRSVSILAVYTGNPLSSVLGKNIDKLASRQERGKIGGSGDER